MMGWTFVETLNCSSFFFHQKAKIHLMFDTFLDRNTIAVHVLMKKDMCVPGIMEIMHFQKSLGNTIASEFWLYKIKLAKLLR
jgi:hypothetical protein